MTPHRVSTMQFADVSFALLQELWDGKVPRKELILQNAMQCAIPSCKMRQILRKCGLEILTPHDQNIAHRCVYTDGCLYTGMLLYTGAFTQRCFSQRYVFLQTLTRTDAFTQRCFYAQLPFTHRCFYNRDSFTPSNFCLQTRRYFYTQMPLHSNAFTHMCFTQAVL